MSFSTNDVPDSPKKLPLQEIPGDYGWPLLGAIRDRYDYFYSQGGKDEYFKSRVQKYKSTVFRCNMPPGFFMAKDPKVVALLLLLLVSFPILFDNSIEWRKMMFLMAHSCPPLLSLWVIVYALFLIQLSHPIPLSKDSFSHN